MYNKFMNYFWINFFNAVNIFPVILVSSSMKLILGQTFNIGLEYSTIVSYAGIISIFKFLFVNWVKNYSLKLYGFKHLENYKKWGLVGSMMMTFFLFLIYVVLSYNYFEKNILAIIITVLTTFVLIGEIINDTAISIFYSNYTGENLSDSIFLGHKLAAFLGYFLFPLSVEYFSFNGTFIIFIILSFILNFSFLYLPTINISNNNQNTNIFLLIKNDLLNIKNIGLILLFIVTCQIGTLIIAGMKCNFIAQITKKKLLSYLLRGLGLLVGVLGGMATGWLKKFKNNDETLFIVGGILHFISVIINYWAFVSQSTIGFITATIFENINKGFMMASLTKFFLIISLNKPHIFTLFWGLFSVLRSIYGGVSGYLVIKLGINKLFMILIILSFLPIIISYKLISNKK
jgi:hypothetical protein